MKTISAKARSLGVNRGKKLPPPTITIDMVRDVVKDMDIELISDEYANAVTKLKVRCLKEDCRHEYEVRYPDLRIGHGCPECANRNRNNDRVMTFEDVLNSYQEYNKNITIVTVLKLEEKVKVHRNLKYKCNVCNHIWGISFNNIRKKRGCPECKRVNNRGENNSSWNPNLTEEEREVGRNIIVDGRSIYPEWRTKVFERDGYRCILCDKKQNINAHHLNGYHWDKENRFNVDNGVTLNIDIHRLFHILYGNKNNTKEQFEEFSIRYKNGEFGE